MINTNNKLMDIKISLIYLKNFILDSFFLIFNLTLINTNLSTEARKKQKKESNIAELHNSSTFN